MFDAIHTMVGEEMPGHGFIEHILPVHLFMGLDAKRADRYSDDDSNDAQGICSRGVALFSDSRIVRARRAELEQEERQLESSSSSAHQNVRDRQLKLARPTTDSANKTAKRCAIAAINRQ